MDNFLGWADASIAGLRGSGSYGVAKAAMHGQVWDLARRLAGDGITVNAVAAGFVPPSSGVAGWTTGPVLQVNGGDLSGTAENHAGVICPPAGDRPVDNFPGR
ncbi:MAG TPA: SDR family oxidoreductase [Bacillota bacterium]|nr:SDR family oxidoreductase [Bacillota bacterium]